MNLRTITFWAIYHPGRKEIIAFRQFKYEIENMHHPDGSVLMKMSGHYVRRPSTSTSSKGPNE